MTADDIRAYCKRRRYSRAYAEYWCAHPWCEICGNESWPPHHIRTRGAGGKDEPENLLGLCFADHQLAHAYGVGWLVRHHPALAGKIERALEVRA